MADRPDPMTDPQQGAERPVVLFLHIPKTAGLTFRHIMNREYGLDRVAYAEERIDTDRVRESLASIQGPGALPERRSGVEPNAAAIEAWSALGARTQARVSAIIGHFWFGLHEHIDRPARYLTFLRDPVDRVVSLHAFAVRYGLRADLRQYVEDGRDAQIDNGQTRRLCGRLPERDIRFDPCDADVLARAMQHLHRLTVVGLTERFDESVLLAARTLGWRFPAHDVHNVTRRRPRLDEIPADVRARIEEHNRFDAALYEEGRRMFEERLAAADPPVDAASLRTLRRANAIFRLRQNHPVAYRPILAGVRLASRGLRAVRGRRNP
jgi:hypothetical protein